MENHEDFVAWLRSVAPYIHAFRGKTFVIAFPGELVKADYLTVLAHDISLLQALGIKVVLVHGSRPQVAEQLLLRNVKEQFFNGIRVTDRIALECVKEAAGELRLDIEAAFSQGLPNTPMAHAHMQIISGNFVMARPLGILEGTDFLHTGITRKIEAEKIHSILNTGSLVLLSPLGFSPTGEAFNLMMEEVAKYAAVALHAEKLIFLTETEALQNDDGELLSELTLDAARELLQTKKLSFDNHLYLHYALEACLEGVVRSHLVPFQKEGAILLEIFTHQGVGTVLAHQDLQSLREASHEDLGGILKLIEPLEQEGTLVKRGREKLEREINYFSVMDHDGIILGCAALYPFPAEKMGELACLTVNPDTQGQGEGEHIARHIENRARKMGLKRLFVLTTRATHWFLKRGYKLASVDDLPNDRQKMYNWQRKSQVLIKNL